MLCSFKVYFFNLLESRLKKAIGHDFKPGDNVLLKNPHKTKTDVFMISNIVGTVKEVLPDGICKVSHKDGEDVFEKNVFVGQLVKWKENESADVQEKEETLNNTGTFTHFQLINYVTDTSDNLRMDFYASKLRSKLQNGLSVLESMKLAVEAYDHFLLAKLHPNDTEQHTAKYLENIRYLKSIRFPFFLYSTVHWERKRKESLGPLLSSLLSDKEHQCHECFTSENICDHNCCRQKALQFAIRCGLFKLSQRQLSQSQRKIVIEKQTGTPSFYF